MTATAKTLSKAGLRQELARRLAEAEHKAVHVGFLVEWQRSLIGTLRAKRGDTARPEEILATLIECRDWFTELARQAARDLDFVDRNSR